MSRKQSRVASGLSPIQRKACIVLAACVLAVVISFVLAWILPQSLNLFGANDSYDPDLYPVDTSLEAVLKDASADDSYITSSLFVGDRTALALQKDGRITLDQYAGKEDLKISNFLKESCVAFEDDANTYTIPQAIAKMKARRVYVMIGSNDVDGSVTVDEFMNDYKQALQNIKNSYSYCDLIACAIPPVVKDSENAAQTQTLIDQFNQAIAEACNEMGYKYLNLSEVLKDSKGYAEASYVDTSAGTLNAAGANAVLEYVKSHAYQTDDTRPDTDDIPKRAAQAASGSSASPTPSATPTKFTANYAVEDSAKGTLTGNGKTGVTSLEIQAESGAQVSVTAVPAEGYTFYKWSDGVTDATRYDVVKKDISVTAMFNDARVELTLDRGDSTIKKGESISITATVKLGGKSYDNSNVQWSVNDELEQNGGTFTFTPSEAGSYVVRAGIEINGTFSSAQITVTVQSDPTAISISGTSTITAGGSTTLNANVQNKQGDVTWRCDETSWQATGDQVTFTANQEGTYHIRASNNGAEAVFELKVSAAPTPVPTPTASPAPSSDSTKQEG
ncbi:GDSL-type esterase/lipase family protein [uncultured Subdoligranulum sp.]|uniref:GDSL-type esterase/lipase family protein n=1 Tax=uncultured Subdoligranulum sp. TaxID=512298 RepID=UPI00262B2AB9|nr:GDSL-type esterase/lipase family protein [uncultured Subdoligranulum sp.]